MGGTARCIHGIRCLHLAATLWHMKNSLSGDKLYALDMRRAVLISREEGMPQGRARDMKTPGCCLKYAKKSETHAYHATYHNSSYHRSHHMSQYTSHYLYKFAKHGSSLFLVIRLSLSYPHPLAPTLGQQAVKLIHRRIT